MAKWNAMLPDDGNTLKVGVAWSGGSDKERLRRRAFDPAILLPLSEIPNVRLYSLQKELPPGLPAPPAALNLIDFTASWRDFSDTAAMIAHLDLVISPDCGIAHVAGAVGRSVLLLPFAPDWRWQLNRGDTPWYPTMRLSRQRCFGSWDGVLQPVISNIIERRSQKNS